MNDAHANPADANPADSRRLREQMVAEQIEARGVSDPRVLDAMRAVPRERFVPAEYRDQAYDDRALPVGPQQTISQPFMVAFMTEHLRLAPSCRVLEVGTGTGYQTAILARLGGPIHSVELDRNLAAAAARRLAEVGASGVQVSSGDGSGGRAESAPYDRIIATACYPSIPGALIDQLTPGGLLILPVGEGQQQTLVRVQRMKRRFVEQPLLACRFVRMVGDHGWKD